MDVDTTSQRLQASNILDSQLMLILLVDGYNLAIFLITFMQILSFLTESCLLNQKMSAKPKRQATVTDMFSRASSSKLMSI